MRSVGKDMKQFKIDIPDKLKERFDNKISWGDKGHIMNALISRLLEAIDTYGPKVVRDIISGKCKIVYIGEGECNGQTGM